MTRRGIALTFALSAGVALGNAGAQAPSELAVRTNSGWVTWWRSTTAPTRWTQPDKALQSVANLRGDEPLAFREISIAASGEAWRTRLIIVRLDPRAVRWRLDTATDEHGYPAWRVDRLHNDALFAVNAGQFGDRYSWGLVVLDGHRYLAAGTGPLVSTIAIDSAGRLHWASGDSSARIASRAQWAFQSYPTLLSDGSIPLPLRERGRGVDLDHRDARLALGVLPDGHLIVVMTRFDALGTSLGFVPFGLTVPEMAAVMGGLGARDAVLLDGGISAQMLIRDCTGALHRWRGVRSVPLGLIGQRR